MSEVSLESPVIVMWLLNEVKKEGVIRWRVNVKQIILIMCISQWPLMQASGSKVVIIHLLRVVTWKVEHFSVHAFIKA